MNSIRIFGKLNVLTGVVTMLVALLAMVLLSGCQKLLGSSQDSLLKGQTVTVSVTVPHEPPPAASPLKPAAEPVGTIRTTPSRPVAASLLPKEDTPQNRLAQLPVAPPLTPPAPAKPRRPVMMTADTVLAGKVVSEDLVLRGSVLVKGSLVIAPQATLKIEPGAVLRFAPAPGTTALPRLVVQGRLVVAGNAQQPVLLGPAVSEPMASDWGGVVLLATEKKNQFDHCRIEGAQTGIMAQFSRFSSRGLRIGRSETGVALYDSEAAIQQADLYRCDVGIKLADSELDLRDAVLQENRQGIHGVHGSFTLSGVRGIKNSQEAVLAEQCRFRIAGCLFAENRTGVKLLGGDGQILLSRMLDNRENGAELTDVRIRIMNSTFSANSGSGLVLERAKGLISGSALVANKGHNLLNRGTGSFAALLNWWGSTDQQQVAAGILDSAGKEASFAVPFVPFLKERPATAP